MATQLLNADADLVSIQDLLGHSRIKTTQRYCTVSNLKVQRDYFKAMEVLMQRAPWGEGLTYTKKWVIVIVYNPPIFLPKTGFVTYSVS